MNGTPPDPGREHGARVTRPTPPAVHRASLHPYGDRRENRAAANAAASTSEDAPTKIPMGCRRKRTSITYAATASIACLVTNFTSAPRRRRASQRRVRRPFNRAVAHRRQQSTPEHSDRGSRPCGAERQRHHGAAPARQHRVRLASPRTNGSRSVTSLVLPRTASTVRNTVRIPAASPRTKHRRNSHGDVPSQRSRTYPSAVPMTTATTNESPTALSAPRLRRRGPSPVRAWGRPCSRVWTVSPARRGRASHRQASSRRHTPRRRIHWAAAWSRNPRVWRRTPCSGAARTPRAPRESRAEREPGGTSGGGFCPLPTWTGSQKTSASLSHPCRPVSNRPHGRARPDPQEQRVRREGHRRQVLYHNDFTAVSSLTALRPTPI